MKRFSQIFLFLVVLNFISCSKKEDSQENTSLVEDAPHGAINLGMDKHEVENILSQYCEIVNLNIAHENLRSKHPDSGQIVGKHKFNNYYICDYSDGRIYRIKAINCDLISAIIINRKYRKLKSLSFKDNEVTEVLIQ